MSNLHEWGCTFILKVEGALADQQTTYQHLRADVFNLHPIIKLDEMREETVARTRVESHGYLRLHAAVLLVASALQEVGRNRRMMADLLEINGTAVDVALEGLAEDGVEGLLHVDGEGVLSDHQHNGVLHALERTGSRCCLFSEDGRVEITLGKGF